MRKWLFGIWASAMVLGVVGFAAGQIAGMPIVNAQTVTPEPTRPAGCPVSAQPTPPPGQPELCFNASASVPGPVEPGAPFVVDVVVENVAPASAPNVIIDVEVVNQLGNRVGQRYLNDRLAAGESKSYSAEFTLNEPGLYQVHLGVFNGDWSYLHQWFNSLASFEINGDPLVRESTPSPFSTPQP